MKRVWSGAASLLLMAALFSFVVVGKVGAQAAPTMRCLFPNNEFVSSTTEGCDLELIKEVSVNGGAFQDANTAGEAVSANVGDEVVWRISVNDTSTSQIAGFAPAGQVRVSDVLPSQVSYVSSTASEGSYDNSTGIWEFTLTMSTTYPVTLTITTEAKQAGLVQNTAELSETQCDGWCTYGDSNSGNNADDAFIDVATPNVPQVLAATTDEETLAETGQIPVASIFAGILILLAIVTVLTSKFSTYKFKA